MPGYLCPHCASPLIPDGDLLRCPRDSYMNTPIDGIRDFLTPEALSHHTEFIEAYRAIRSSERRGSYDPAYYLALPSVPDGPKSHEWSLRAGSMAWLRLRLGNGGRTILDAGAGSCWLTRHLAEWGNEVTALDLNIDPYDGLAAGRHYLAALPISFDRVRADFARLPFVEGAFDVVIFNASFHYAENPDALLAEARRVMKPAGEIILIDSPVYTNAASGRKMLAERKQPGRAGFLTYDGLAELAHRASLGLMIEEQHPTMLEWVKRRVREMLMGRGIASMPRVVFRGR